MRFIAIALLALCLVQGNNAQFGLGTIKSAASCWLGWCNEDSSSSEEIAAPAKADEAPAPAPVAAAAKAVKAVAAAPKRVAASSAVIISNMPGLSVLSANPEAVVKAAVDPKTTADAAGLAEGLSMREHLELVKTVKSAVTEQAAGVARRIEVLVQNTAAKTGCAESMTKDAKELAEAIHELPKRAAEINKEGIITNKKCQQTAAGLLQKRCRVTELAPISLKACDLVKDTHQYTVEAMHTVKKLRAEFAVCTKKARDNKKK